MGSSGGIQMLCQERRFSSGLSFLQREPPENFSSDIPVPDASSINHHKVNVYRTDTLSEELRRTPEYTILPVDKFPFPLQLNQIQSSFAEVCVCVLAHMLRCGHAELCSLSLSLSLSHTHTHARTCFLAI